MGTTPLAHLFETKMTGRQPAGEAVRGAVLSTRSYRAKTYAGARYAETGQQHGRAQVVHRCFYQIFSVFRNGITSKSADKPSYRLFCFSQF